MAGGIGLGLSLGGAATGGVDGLREVLKRQFLASVEQRIAEDEDLNRAQNQSQFDAMQGIRERGMSLDEEVARRPPPPVAPRAPIQLRGVIGAGGKKVSQFIDPETFATLREIEDFQEPQGPSPIDVENVRHTNDLAEIRERARLEQQAAAAARAAQGAAAGTTGAAADQNKLDEVDQAMTTIDTLEKHPGIYASVGFKGPTNYLPGTNAADFNAYFDALKSQLTFPNLQKMRGLGAMSNIEFSTLQKASTALDRSMTEQTFRKELANIKANLQRIQDRIKRGVKVDPNTGAEIGTGRATGAGALPPAAAALGITRVGG